MTSPAWRKRFSRRIRALLREGWAKLPDFIVIDGGKGQLNAAVAELDKLGLDNIAMIGLAKEFEEIYRPGRDEPLRLSHDSGALKLLQRVRDESHRFANTYNAQLRLKKISESILDEFPGIGQLAQGGAAQKIRLGAAPAFRHCGRHCRRAGLWRQGGGRTEKISRGPHSHAQDGRGGGHSAGPRYGAMIEVQIA